LNTKNPLKNKIFDQLHYKRYNKKWKVFKILLDLLYNLISSNKLLLTRVLKLKSHINLIMKRNWVIIYINLEDKAPLNENLMESIETMSLVEV